MKKQLRRPLVVLAAGLVVGCASRVPPAIAPPSTVQIPVVAAHEIAARPVALAPDTIATLIASADREFAAGEAELKAGRLVAARQHFDRTIDLILETPGGPRSEPRLARAFERLLDRISALDVQALREGDGFTEAKSEPAVIDALLGATTFETPPQPTLTTAETVAEDLATTKHELPIAMNEKVLSYIELFQGRLRQFLEDGLNRSQQYLPMIQAVFKKEGLPMELAFVPLVESGFKPNALSRASARGMWQFMQGTAQEHGLRQNWFLDERSDPEKATVAAAQYLKTLSGMFDGDWNLALASYNAGPGRIMRATRQSKSFDYWKITSSTRYLPRETREYVPMIQAAIIIASNPERYGFEIDAPTPVAYDVVSVNGALDLKFIAEWAGVAIEDIQKLNPELRRTTTPLGSHDLKVPLGTGATVKQKLATADPSLFVTFKFHTVKRGETVTSIARRYNLKTTDLRAANDLSASARLKANTTLRIPERSTSALPTAPSSSRPTAVASARTPASTSASGSQSTPVYRVKRGDTLFSIARLFDTTVGELKKLNSLRSDAIGIGDRLRVRR
jgi:membrane-bound lytic murein transglycosylase D